MQVEDANVSGDQGPSSQSSTISNQLSGSLPVAACSSQTEAVFSTSNQCNDDFPIESIIQASRKGIQGDSAKEIIDRVRSEKVLSRKSRTAICTAVGVYLMENAT